MPNAGFSSFDFLLTIEASIQARIVVSGGLSIPISIGVAAAIVARAEMRNGAIESGKATMTVCSNERGNLLLWEEAGPGTTTDEF